MIQNLISKNTYISRTPKSVKGHDDRTTDYSKVLKAHLNVDADELAGPYQDQYGKVIPTVEMLPSSPAIFSLRVSDITGQYLKRKADPAWCITTKNLAKLQKQFDRFVEAISDIAWFCLIIAITRIYKAPNYYHESMQSIPR